MFIVFYIFYIKQKKKLIFFFYQDKYYSFLSNIHFVFIPTFDKSLFVYAQHYPLHDIYTL